MNQILALLAGIATIASVGIGGFMAGLSTANTTNVIKANIEKSVNEVASGFPDKSQEDMKELLDSLLELVTAASEKSSDENDSKLNDATKKVIENVSPYSLSYYRIVSSNPLITLPLQKVRLFCDDQFFVHPITHNSSVTGIHGPTDL